MSASQSAAFLLSQAASRPRFSSGCDAIDALFTPALSSPAQHSEIDGEHARGLAQGHVLELSGPPGSGKSRICLGFIMNTRFSTEDIPNEVLIMGILLSRS